MNSSQPEPDPQAPPLAAPGVPLRGEDFPPQLVRAALAASLCAGALGAFLLGQDGGFDLKNYHYYNAWALLGGRLSHDFVVAQQQTWFNPLLDLLYYLPTRVFGPAPGSALLGAMQGVNFWLLLLISGRLLSSQSPDWSPRAVRGVAIACALVGAYGPIGWAGLGSSRGDLTVSLFVLSSLWVLLQHPRFDASGAVREGSSGRLLFASGLLMGLGCGLKPTMASFAVGAALALVLVGPGSARRRFRTSLIWCGGAFLAILLSGGPWMLVLWEHYGSPIFPFANHIFGSPYAPLESFADLRFRPDGLGGFLSFPLQFAAGGEVAWEFAFRDPRLSLLCILVVAYGLRLWFRPRAERAPAPPSLRLLLVFAVASYAVWQVVFCVYRYLAPLELLSPLLIVALLVRLVPRPGAALAVSAGALAVIVGMVRLPDVERLPWQDNIFGVELPQPTLADDSIVLLAGDDATSYLVTYFPPRVRFLRIAGNFGFPEDDTFLNRDMRRVLADADGPLYFLKGPYEIDHESLAAFGLALVDGSCRPIRSRVDDNLALCDLRRR